MSLRVPWERRARRRPPRQEHSISRKTSILKQDETRVHAKTCWSHPMKLFLAARFARPDRLDACTRVASKVTSRNKSNDRVMRRSMQYEQQAADLELVNIVSFGDFQTASRSCRKTQTWPEISNRQRVRLACSESSGIPGHASHEDGLERLKRDDPLVSSQKQRALLVPVINST